MRLWTVVSGFESLSPSFFIGRTSRHVLYHNYIMKSKSDLITLLGPFPEKAPQDATIEDSTDHGSFTLEKVSYNVEPGERISAYVLIPKKLKAKAPAVFCHHQHAGNYALGKSEVVGLDGDPTQAYARELAERGYITFAPDAVGFEERARGDPPEIHAYFDLAARLVSGRTLLAKVLHDVSVGLDYLVSRDDVDAHKFGFIGHSYGGRMAIWAQAFDNRIKASVSNCGCISYRESLSEDTGIQTEFCVPRIMEWGDIEDVIKLIAPRAILISAAKRDKWSRGAKELYDTAQLSFPPGQLDLALYPGGHAFTIEMRQRAYNFLDSHLLEQSTRPAAR